jgi:hypothetical protein
MLCCLFSLASISRISSRITRRLSIALTTRCTYPTSNPGIDGVGWGGSDGVGWGGSDGAGWGGSDGAGWGGSDGAGGVGGGAEGAWFFRRWLSALFFRLPASL